MDYIALIRQKYGDACRVCPPLSKEDYEAAAQRLPAELLAILQRSNGIEELMTHPKVDDGKPFPIGYIVYSYQEILDTTALVSELYGGEGIAFSGNGAGGYYVLKEDGTVWLYEYVGEEGECVAEDLAQFFAK